MKIKEYSKADKVAETYSISDTSVAATCEVHPVVDEGALRSLVFAGIRTKQMEIKDGTAELTTKAFPIFVSRLAATLNESIIHTSGITHRQLDKVAYKDKTEPSVAQYLKELKEATEAIDKKYKVVGGLLGNPVTEVEFGGKNYEIPYRKYQRGAIYVTPHGTHEVHGAIYQKYLALGGLNSFLGFPETDEQSTTLGTGRFNHFQVGQFIGVRRLEPGLFTDQCLVNGGKWMPNEVTLVFLYQM
jgi:LGFP repeat